MSERSISLTLWVLQLWSSPRCTLDICLTGGITLISLLTLVTRAPGATWNFLPAPASPSNFFPHIAPQQPAHTSAFRHSQDGTLPHKVCHTGASRLLSDRYNPPGEVVFFCQLGLLNHRLTEKDTDITCWKLLTNELSEYSKARLFSGY